MTAIKNILGQRFGSLVAIRFIGLRAYGRKSKHNKAIWEFRCDCGNVKEIGSGEVVKGNTKTCGCRGYKIGDSVFTCVYHSIKYSAERRGLEWKITKEFVRFITQKNCFYCGKEPSTTRRERDYKGEYVYNGIDRVDNSRGYTADNVVPCCEQCNRAKLQHSADDFKSWVINVYTHWAGKSVVDDVFIDTESLSGLYSEGIPEMS